MQLFLLFFLVLQIFVQLTDLNPENAEKMQAATILHSFIRLSHQNFASDSVCAKPGAALNAAGWMGSNRASWEALAVQEVELRTEAE